MFSPTPYRAIPRQHTNIGIGCHHLHRRACIPYTTTRRVCLIKIINIRTVIFRIHNKIFINIRLTGSTHTNSWSAIDLTPDSIENGPLVCGIGRAAHNTGIVLISLSLRNALTLYDTPPRL
jgi:hypothetical protein